jgi:hypothetical protein
VESGLFNGLQAKNKKILPFPTRVAGCRETPLGSLARSFMPFLSPRALWRHQKVSISRKYTKDSGFSQGFVASNEDECSKMLSFPDPYYE